jgi:MFS family permease
MDPEANTPEHSSISDTAEKVALAQRPQPRVNEPVATPTPVTPPPAPKAGAGPPTPPPDGGLQAWLQVLGSFSILTSTWGLVNAFGVFQTHYEIKMLTSHSASSISWIGSLQASLLFLGGLVSGPLFDAGYFRAELVSGLLMISFGMFMTSICKEYWQLVLAQGAVVGLGMGLVFLPTAGLVAQYFSKRRAFALGVGGVGSPVGGIVFPIIFSRLEPRVGFGWATRVVAFIILGLSVVPIVFMRPRNPPSGRMRSLLDTTAFADVGFLSFALGFSLAFLVLYTAFFYIQIFTQLHGYSSADFAPYTVTLVNVGSIIGRLGPTYAADKLGQVNVIAFCTFASGVLYFGWMGVHNLAGVVVFGVLFGAFSGGVVNVAASALMTFAPDVSKVGTRMGMAFCLSGVLVLVGTPITGAILREFTGTRWLGAFGYSGGAMLLGTVCMLVARHAKASGRDGWKF